MQPNCRCLSSDIPSMKLHWPLSLRQKQWRHGSHGPVRPKSAKEGKQRKQRRASFWDENGISQTIKLAQFSGEKKLLSLVQRQSMSKIQAFWRPCEHYASETTHQKPSWKARCTLIFGTWTCGNTKQRLTDVFHPSWWGFPVWIFTNHTWPNHQVWLPPPQKKTMVQYQVEASSHQYWWGFHRFPSCLLLGLPVLTHQWSLSTAEVTRILGNPNFNPQQNQVWSLFWSQPTHFPIKANWNLHAIPN